MSLLCLTVSADPRLFSETTDGLSSLIGWLTDRTGLTLDKTTKSSSEGEGERERGSHTVDVSCAQTADCVICPTWCVDPFAIWRESLWVGQEESCAALNWFCSSGGDGGERGGGGLGWDGWNELVKGSRAMAGQGQRQECAVQ